MIHASGDTIAAIATPRGRGGVGVIRISGDAVPSLLGPLLGKRPEPRHASFGGFLDHHGQAIDQGLALYFPAPHSFTGEHVLELHAHGSPVVLDLLLERLIQLKCRLARPGEFSERAFLNRKMDLAQAEAIADLIDSATAAAARAAQRSLKGVFSEQIHALVETLIELRLLIEAAIDFSDEEIDFLTEAKVMDQLKAMEKQLASIRSMALKGQRLREGATLVLVGRPNAGKSSLLNRLAGEDRAIVTPIPGTTRDTLREAIQLEGIPLHIIDTAGLRDDATDPVEREGIQRTRAAIAVADLILLMVDDNDVESDGALIDALPDGIPMIFIHNKIDLSGNAAGRVPSDRGIKVRISLKSGDGIDDLLRVLIHQLGIEPEQEGAFTARRRHLEALEAALSGVLGAQRECQAGSQDLAAEQLRLSQRALSEITGDFSSDDLLGRIFANFCIGK